ncbi:MAG: DMT family transporter [Aquaticitalea sp.]
MKVRTGAIIAVLMVQLLYGLNYTFAKDVMAGGYLTPYGFILLRVGGAALLFWLFSWMGPKEEIDKRDYIKFFIAAIFGVVVNMLLFFKGLEFTTPIHASVIVTLTPVLVLILSAIFLKEKVSFLKVLGVAFGLAGAVVLTVYGKSTRPADNVLLGNTFVFMNMVSYSIYIILIKKLTTKYHPFTFIKWLFLFGFFMVLPFGYSDVMATEFSTFSPFIIFSVLFVVIGATFGTYLLNPLALRHLKATTVTIFIYVQPVIAGIFAILMGSDTLGIVKIIASALIFTGVYLVTMRPRVSD